MFGIAPSEILIVALVAIVFIGPKDLPRAMRFAGQWFAKGRAITRHVHDALDRLVRESELAEMEQKWKAENARILQEYTLSVGGVRPPQVPATDEAVHAVPMGMSVVETNRGPGNQNRHQETRDNVER